MGVVGISHADVVDIKSDAPVSYEVQKGDTLWDISNLFLDKPWLWPELWRNNTQIENPHLIYPGDTLVLRYENGKPVIEVVRDEENVRDKNAIVMTPQGVVTKKLNPISTLAWDRIAPFIRNDSLMDAKTFNELPTLLGDSIGTPRFADQDYVLTRQVEDPKATYNVVRAVREVFDSEGNSLGIQLTHLSDASVSNSLSDQRHIVRLQESSLETRQGDKLVPAQNNTVDDLQLMPAQEQVGEIVENINGYSLIASQDVVIVNLGENDVAPGTVFGIYKQGPDVLTGKNTEYAEEKSVLDVFSLSDRVAQPAYKVGELVVIRSFDNASYAWVSKTNTFLRGGEFIAKP
jgi:hypothetical protein